MTGKEYIEAFEVKQSTDKTKCCGNCDYAFTDKHDKKFSCFNPLISYPQARIVIENDWGCYNWQKLNDTYEH